MNSCIAALTRACKSINTSKYLKHVYMKSKTMANVNLSSKMSHESSLHVCNSLHSFRLYLSLSLSPRKLKINLAIYMTWNQLIHKCILKLCLYYYLVLVFNYFWYGLSAEIFWVHNAHRRKWLKISTFWWMSWREEIILIFRLSASLMLLLVKTFKLSWEKKNNL